MRDHLGSFLERSKQVYGKQLPLYVRMAKLGELLDDGDPEALAEAKKLSQFGLNTTNQSRVAQLMKHIDDFDFQSAQELLTNLRI